MTKPSISHIATFAGVNPSATCSVLAMNPNAGFSANGSNQSAST
jgi:hypothetical protein